MDNTGVQFLFCNQCGEELRGKANFCHNCGHNNTGIRGSISKIRKRFGFQSKVYLSTLRDNVSKQIDSYLKQIDKDENLQLGNINIPENRKLTIKNALLSFQNRLGYDDELTEEFQQWLENLPNLIGDQKCVICFLPWEKSDTIVVCKYCQAGGHKEHIENWVSQKRICPLCRKELGGKDLHEVDLSSIKESEDNSDGAK